MMRDMRVAPWLLVVCSLVVSCDVVPICSAENCIGCCSSDGTCLSGSTSGACGSQGNTCSRCPTSAQCVSTATCTFGTSCALRLCQFGSGGGGGGNPFGGGTGGGFFGGGAGGGAGGSPFGGGGGFNDGGGAGGGGGSCLPESDAVLCARLRLDCGSVNIMDVCGLSRSLSCGTCSSPRVCGGDGLANVCSTPCVPESDATFCARLGASCGSATQFDNCGATRTVASCGACMNDCQTQSTCMNNACIGTPKADGERCGAPTARDFCRSGQCTTAQSYCEASGTQFIYSSATKTTSGAGPCVCSTSLALRFEYGGSSLPAENDTCSACTASTQRAVCF